MEGFSIMKNKFINDNEINEEKMYFNSVIKADPYINKKETSNNSLNKIAKGYENQNTENIVNSISNVPFLENFKNASYQSNNQKSSISVFDSDRFLIENLSRANSNKAKNSFKPDKNKEDITHNKSGNHNNPHFSENENLENIDSNRKFSFTHMNIKDKCDICTKDIEEGFVSSEERNINKCRKCNIIIHKSCNKQVEYIKEDLCSKCLSEFRNPQTSNKHLKIKCYACDKSEGSMININSKWIHFLCLSSLKRILNLSNNNNIGNEIYKIISNNFSETIEKIQRTKAMNCRICSKRSFFTVKCNGCDLHFHAYCAYLHNLENLNEKRHTKVTNFSNEENSNLFKSSLSSSTNLQMYNLNQSSLNQSKNISINYLNIFEFEIKCISKHSMYSKLASYYEIKKFDNKLKEKDLNMIANRNKLIKETSDKLSSRIITGKDSNYIYHLNVNLKNKTIDCNGRIKDCLHNTCQIDNRKDYDLESLNVINEIKHSHSNLNENKIIKLQPNTSSQRNSQKDLNKENDKILENDIILNPKSKIKKYSKKEKRMKKISKSTKANLLEEELSQNDSSDFFEEKSEYFTKNNKISAKNLNTAGEAKKKYNKLIPANLRENRNSEHKLDPAFNYQQNIKSISMKYLKEKFSKINSVSIIDLYDDKKLSEEELVKEQKKFFSSWDFIQEYFKKFHLEDLNKIKSECLEASNVEEEKEIFNQYINFWFAQNKIEHNFLNEQNSLQLKTIPEDKNLFINRSYKHFSDEDLYDKNGKFLKIKRNSRVCRVRKNDKDLLLFYEISTFNDLYDKCKTQDNYSLSKLSWELELNEINKYNSPAEINSINLPAEVFKKIRYISNRKFQIEEDNQDNILNYKSTDEFTSEYNLQKEKNLNFKNPRKTNYDNLTNQLNKPYNIEDISPNNDLNPNITVSDCLKKISIKKSILEGIILNQVTHNTNEIYNKRKKIYNTIKLKNIIEIKANEQKAFDLQDSAMINIQDSFNKLNKNFLYNKAEESTEDLEHKKELSLDTLKDIDRLILINEEMLKQLTNDNKLVVNDLLVDIKERILNNKNRVIEKLIKQTNTSSKVFVYENQDNFSNCYENEISNQIIDINKIKEIDKIFYLPFSIKKNEEGRRIADLIKFKESTQDLKIFIENSNEIENCDIKKMEIDENQTEEIVRYNNPGIIEIKNYDIMEKENFDLINNSFLTEYYSNNRFHHIKKRLKLGFRDKRIDTIIKSRFTTERVNQEIGEHTQESLMSFNKKENQNNPNYVKIIQALEKSDSDCCICMYSELDDTSVIVFCDCCNVGMHLECYGISNVDDIYLCDVCVYILKNFKEINFSLKNKEFITNKLSSETNVCLTDSALEADNSYYKKNENGKFLKNSNSIIKIDLMSNTKNYPKDHSTRYKQRLGKNQINYNDSRGKTDAEEKVFNSKMKIPLDFNGETFAIKTNNSNDNFINTHLLNSITNPEINYEKDMNGNKSVSMYENKRDIQIGIRDNKPKKLKSEYKSENNNLKRKNFLKESENKNANSILNHIKCIICCQSRGPMKNINEDQGDWAHIICLIFSINYQIFDYGKILVKKLSSNDNYMENFINNYSFYFKQDYIISLESANDRKIILSPLDYYKEKQKDVLINSCEVCTASIGEVFPCLSCLEERKLQNNKIPHFHVLCAYLNGNKMETIENEEKISFENYYNFLLKREKLDKYLIRRSRIYANIKCASHSQESGRDSEVQLAFRNLVYHTETYNYKLFWNKFQLNIKDKNSTLKLKDQREKDDVGPDLNFERNDSMKKSIRNFGLKQSDNSTEGKITLNLSIN